MPQGGPVFDWRSQIQPLAWSQTQPLGKSRERHYTVFGAYNADRVVLELALNILRPKKFNSPRATIMRPKYLKNIWSCQIPALLHRHIRRWCVVTPGPRPHPAASKNGQRWEWRIGMSCEQNINISGNKVKSGGQNLIPISIIYFLSKMDPNIIRKQS